MPRALSSMIEADEDRPWRPNRVYKGRGRERVKRKTDGGRNGKRAIVSEIERDRDRVQVCVCVREKEKERERERGEGERER